MTKWDYIWNCTCLTGIIAIVLGIGALTGSAWGLLALGLAGSMRYVG